MRAGITSRLKSSSRVGDPVLLGLGWEHAVRNLKNKDQELTFDELELGEHVKQVLEA